MHQTLDAAILPRSICKSAALPKGRIAPCKHTFESSSISSYTRHFPMIKSAYHIAKNASTIYMHLSWILTISHACPSWRCYCFCLIYEKISTIHIFYVSLLEQDYKEEAGVQEYDTNATVAPPTQGTWRSNNYVNALRLVDMVVRYSSMEWVGGLYK